MVQGAGRARQARPDRTRRDARRRVGCAARRNRQRPLRCRSPSLLKAESIMLGVRHEKEGKLRVTYAHWDDAKVVLDGQVLDSEVQALFRRRPRWQRCGSHPRLGKWRMLTLQYDGWVSHELIEA